MGWRGSKASFLTPPRNMTLGGYFNKGRFEPKHAASSEKLDCLEERLGRKSQSNCSLCYEFALAQVLEAYSRGWYLLSWAATLKASTLVPC